MARSTAFRYKGKEIDPQTVGRELNVRAVIVGRLLKRGDLVTLGLELVDVEDGVQLWSAYFNRKLADIFDVQEQIATEISVKLRVRLISDQRKPLVKRHTKDPEEFFRRQRRTARLFNPYGCNPSRALKFSQFCHSDSQSSRPAHGRRARTRHQP
jgi:hypothetical protein